MSRLLGLGWIPFGLIPVLAAGWFFGLRGGLFAAVAMNFLGTTMAAMLGSVPWTFYWHPTNLARFAIGLLSGGLLGHTRDLRKRLEERTKEAEADRARLAATQAHLAQAQDLASLGSWEADLVAMRVWSSPVLRRLLGINGEAALGFPVALDLVHPEDRDRFVARFQEFLERGGAHDDEVRIRRPDGQIRNLRLHGRADVGRDGKPRRITGIAQDVTDVRQAEAHKRVAEQRRMDIEHLAELNRFKSQFVSAAAHELNTPMTPIILQLELLHSPEIGPLNPKQEHALNVLERNIKRLSMLLRDLLDASRLQGQGLRLMMESVDPSRLVQEAADSFRPLAERARVKLVVDAPPLGPTWTDPRRLSQVLFNLLSNAFKFTPVGKTVRIALSQNAGWIRIAVDDEGVGLRPDQRARLFQPFTQVADEPNSIQGTGLGLYVSKGIVEQMGGRIDVTSPGEGMGSTFLIELPRARFAPDSPRQSSLGPVLSH